MGYPQLQLFFIQLWIPFCKVYPWYLDDILVVGKTKEEHYRLGEVLSRFQIGRAPIAFASRTLYKSEHNHEKIEKKALALVYGVEKFHKYIL